MIEFIKGGRFYLWLLSIFLEWSHPLYITNLSLVLYIQFDSHKLVQHFCITIDLYPLLLIHCITTDLYFPSIVLFILLQLFFLKYLGYLFIFSNFLQVEKFYNIKFHMVGSTISFNSLGFIAYFMLKCSNI